MIALLLAAALAAEPVPPPAAEEPGSLYGLRGVDLGCAPCVGLAAFHPKATASTTLAPDSRYGAAMVLDGDMSTAWCEGLDGPGAGATLDLVLDRPAAVYAVAVWGGYFKSPKVLADNHRVRTATLTVDGQSHRISLPDPTVPLAVDPSTGFPVDPAGWFDQARTGEPPWTVVDSGQTTRLRLVLDQVWPGSRADDTCISEITVLVVDPQDL